MLNYARGRTSPQNVDPELRAAIEVVLTSMKKASQAIQGNYTRQDNAFRAEVVSYVISLRNQFGYLGTEHGFVHRQAKCAISSPSQSFLSY